MANNKLKSNVIAEIATLNNTKGESIPLMLSRVAAGFPSSAENYLDKVLDLNELLIKHPAATFFIRVKGDSMQGAGIHSDDILIVDRSLSAAHNKIVIARIHDEFTVKRIKIDNEKMYLVPDNDKYQAIEVTDEMDAEVWGVVIFIIHKA